MIPHKVFFGPKRLGNASQTPKAKADKDGTGKPDVKKKDAPPDKNRVRAQTKGILPTQEVSPEKPLEIWPIGDTQKAHVKLASLQYYAEGR